MFEFTSGHFERLCRIGPVEAEIKAFEGNRKKALKKFFLYLAGSVLISIGLGYAIGGEWGWIVGGIILFGGIYLAFRPLQHAKEGLKHPVLSALAEEAGITYMPEGFDPPAYPVAGQLLFGRTSEQEFTDLFWGGDADGRSFAIYEALLHKGSGRSRASIFSGQIYAFQRKPGLDGVTVIRPAFKLLNMFKPQRGMERVRVGIDPTFDKTFAVHSTAPLQAQQLLFDGAFRRQLLELRRNGFIYVYIGPEDALVAVTDKNRFESGSMFRSQCGQQRVRVMFDDVGAALALLKNLKARLA